MNATQDNKLLNGLVRRVFWKKLINLFFPFIPWSTEDSERDLECFSETRTAGMNSTRGNMIHQEPISKDPTEKEMWVLKNRRRLLDLVEKAGLTKAPGQKNLPAWQALYFNEFGNDNGLEFFCDGPERQFPLLIFLVLHHRCKPIPEVADLSKDERDDLIRTLGELGCRTEEGDKTHWTALHVAAQFAPLTPEYLRLLINVGCSVNRCSGDRVTPFHLAALGQNPLTPDLCRAFAAAGADLAARDTGGWDALTYLANGGSPVLPETVNLLIETGCRTSLDGYEDTPDKTAVRFDEILLEWRSWKAAKTRLAQECDASERPDGCEMVCWDK